MLLADVKSLNEVKWPIHVQLNCVRSVQTHTQTDFT